MNEISLKIKVAGKEYPMKVVPEEESTIKQAAVEVNEKLKLFQSQFGIEDKQDLLAMIAFDGRIKDLRRRERESDQMQKLMDRMESLHRRLDTALEKS